MPNTLRPTVTLDSIPTAFRKPLHLLTHSYAVDFQVDNILLFPDLEKNFEMFEPVRSMQASGGVSRKPSVFVRLADLIKADCLLDDLCLSYPSSSDLSHAYTHTGQGHRRESAFSRDRVTLSGRLWSAAGGELRCELCSVCVF